MALATDNPLVTPKLNSVSLANVADPAPKAVLASNATLPAATCVPPL